MLSVQAIVAALTQGSTADEVLSGAEKLIVCDAEQFIDAGGMSPLIALVDRNAAALRALHATTMHEAALSRVVCQYPQVIGQLVVAIGTHPGLRCVVPFTS
jgi:hypothetical protein